MASPMMEFGAMDIIVGLSLLFALALVVAWIVSPSLRAWIERPKYRFQSNVRSYDEAQVEASEPAPRSGTK